MHVLISLLALAPQGTAIGSGERLWQSQAVDNDRCGAALAIDADRVVLGAPEKYGSGAIYLFREQGGAWVEEVMLQDSGTSNGDEMGVSVALQGDLALAGAEGFDTLGPFTNTGAVVSFERSPGGTWARTGRIVPAGIRAQDRFGRAIDLDGDVLVATSPFDDDRAQDAGAAYVFRRTAGVWVEEVKLVAPDGQADERLATCAIDGDWLALGALEASHTLGFRSGAVYMFRHGPTGWTFDQKLVASNGSAGDRFSYALSLSDGVLVVGAPDAGPGNGGGASDYGQVYVFELGAGGTWTEVAALSSPDVGSARYFGAAVTVNRDRIAIGDYGASNQIGTNYARFGVMHFYQRTATAWTHVAEVIETSLMSNDQYGSALALGPSSIVVSAPRGGALGASIGGTSWVYPLSEVFQRYCDPAVPTTAGTSAEMDASGSSFVVDNNLRLECSGMPANVFGYFIAGDQFAFVPGAGGSFGDLCVGGQVLRFNDVVPTSGPGGTFERVVDLTQAPVIGAFPAGAPWYFQAWFRDGSRSNLSNAVIVPFR